MKPNILFFSLFLIGLVFMSSSCGKEPSEDPRFSCKINGELWNPKDGNYSFGLTANYDYDPSIGRDVFKISAVQHGHPKYIELTLHIDSPKIGTYYPDPEDIILRKENLEAFKIDSKLPSLIEIYKFDTNKRIASGVFNGYLRYYLTPHEGDSIHITEGKFNVKF